MRHLEKTSAGRKARLFGTAAMAAAALAFSTGAMAQAKPPVPKENLVLVASVINTTNPYMIANIQGAQALSKKLGIPLEIVNSNGSSQTEISKIQAILATGKTALVFVNTVASSDAPPIVAAVKK